MEEVATINVSAQQEARSHRAGLFLGSVGLGFVSIAGQVILLRELASSLGGNELALGGLLGSWLLWTGAGSLLADKVRWHNPLAPAFAYTKLGVLFPSPSWPSALSVPCSVSCPERWSAS